MYITLETDYAVRIVDALARRAKMPKTDLDKHPNRLDAKTIAEQSNIPLRFALKILGKLVAGEIVCSFKGVNGGYELARQLSDISLYDIVVIVEGNYHFSRCLDGDYPCNCGADGLPCAYQKAFGELSEVVRDKLKDMTFDRFVEQAE